MIVEFVIFLSLLLFYAILRDRKPTSMPPGPWEFPFVGNTVVETTKQSTTLKEKYGPIVTTRFGKDRQVLIFDYDLAKEAMASSECADRTPLFRAFRIDPKEDGGVVNSNGMQWIHDRRFVLRHLRDLGMGKSNLEIAINEEARGMVQFLKNLKDQPSPVPSCFRRVVLNVVWQLVAGKRYDLYSHEVDVIFNVFERFRDNQTALIFIEEFFPIVKVLPIKLRYYLFNLKIMDEFRSEMSRIISETIAEHETNLDEDDSKDLIDDYLIAMKQSKNDPENRFRNEFLTQTISDLFAAGSDTVTNMLRWVVFLMVKYPETMRKCQEEIDREVAEDQFVSLTDKSRLPYTEAYMHEALRFSSMINLNPARYTNADYKIGGYMIPKGTAVTVDNYWVHHDPKFWKDPHNFDPSRFLDENGKFKAKLGRTFAFGSGRRECIGVPLAMMEFFLFSSALLQNFTIEVPEGETLDCNFVETVGARMVPNQTLIYKYRNR